MLPHFDAPTALRLQSALGIQCLPELVEALAGPRRDSAIAALVSVLGGKASAQDCIAVCERMPIVEVGACQGEGRVLVPASVDSSVEPSVDWRISQGQTLVFRIFECVRVAQWVRCLSRGCVSVG